MVGLYDTAGYLPHIIAVSPSQEAVYGWNQVDIVTRLIPPGNYMLAVEGSNTIQIASQSPGMDQYARTNWGFFPSFVPSYPSYTTFSVNADFCAYPTLTATLTATPTPTPTL